MISQTAVSTFQHFGVQEKIIRKLMDDGTNLMIQPSDIKNMFKTYGVRPVLPPKYISVPREVRFSSIIQH